MTATVRTSVTSPAVHGKSPGSGGGKESGWGVWGAGEKLGPVWFSPAPHIRICIKPRLQPAPETPGRATAARVSIPFARVFPVVCGSSLH
jgi:hypothetical protein